MCRVAEEIVLSANGLRFVADAEGPAGGPPVLLLHGFPELARSWRHQLPALAAAGWRAVAPDLRGYGRTDRRGPYDLGTLARDVAGLVRALGRERTVVCGHDWGGAAAWAAAALEPAAVERLVVLACPHPVVMAGALRRSPRQLARSSYMLFFQLPWLPERLLARHGGAAVARALRGGSFVRSAFPPEELARYRAAFSTVEAARAALGWYRAAFRRPLPLLRMARARIAAPALILRGAQDRFLGPETMDAAETARLFAPGVRPELRVLEGAGHFLQNEAPERVNAALLEWLGRPLSPPSPA